MSSENALLPRVWELERSLATAVRVNESLRQQLATLKAEIKSIGKAIDDPRTDLTMTMSEVIIDQKQQLAEAQTTLAHAAQIKGMDDQLIAASLKREVDALAACKRKDKAISAVLSNLLDPYGIALLEQALAIRPDDAALKAWLGEPVAWKHDDPNRHDAITDTVKELLQQVNAEYMHRPIDKTEHYTIPLYSPKGLK